MPHTLKFNITEICGESVNPKDWSFKTGFWSADKCNKSLFDGDDGPVRVYVEPHSINEEYQPIREFRVAGLSDQRQAIREFLRSERNKWGLEPEHGLLLEGPPGTGKTELVMEICREEFGAVPVEISGPEILSRWLGESERILRERFEQARSNPANVLYIDELDSIARSRGKATQEYSAQIVAQLLVLLDGLDTKRNKSPVKVIASTNMAKLIDEALRRPGRLGRTISFEPLSGSDTFAVLHHYLEQIYRNQQQSDSDATEGKTGILSSELEEFVTSGNIEELSNRETADDLRQFFSGRTGAEIKQIVQKGTKSAEENDNVSVDKLQIKHLLRSSFGEYERGKVISASEKGFDGSDFTAARILRVSPSNGKKTAEEEFEAYLSTHDEYTEGVFRTIEPNEKLFSVNEQTVWRQIWETLRANRDRPVCVYFDHYDRIDRIADHSSQAQKVIEALCERLAVEISASSPPTLFAYSSTTDSEHLQLPDLFPEQTH